jgi:hypothetical protein
MYMYMIVYIYMSMSHVCICIWQRNASRGSLLVLNVTTLYWLACHDALQGPFLSRSSLSRVLTETFTIRQEGGQFAFLLVPLQILAMVSKYCFMGADQFRAPPTGLC